MLCRNLIRFFYQHEFTVTESLSLGEVFIYQTLSKLSIVISFEGNYKLQVY